MKYLPTVKATLKVEEETADSILEVLLKIIFEPLQTSFAKTVVLNQKTPLLLEALQKGNVYYQDGLLKPKHRKLPFRLAQEIKKIGGKYTPAGYRVLLTPEIIRTLTNMQNQAFFTQQSLLRNINDIQAELVFWEQKNQLTPRLQEILSSTDFNGRQVLENINSQISPLPTLNPFDDTTFTSNTLLDYISNTQISIKNFSTEMLNNIRTDISNAFAEGLRYEFVLNDILQKEYNITKNKARFLARNETGLLTASYTKHKFTSAGVQYYQWASSEDKRVRDWHSYLNGKIFAYNNPPIINLDNQQKGNPKEDYNCRCRARPIVLLENETLVPQLGAEGITYYTLQKV